MSLTMRRRLEELAALEPPARRQRFQEVMAGVEVFMGVRGRGFISLTDAIATGMAVSDEMQRRTRLAEDTRRARA